MYKQRFPNHLLVKMRNNNGKRTRFHLIALIVILGLAAQIGYNVHADATSGNIHILILSSDGGSVVGASVSSTKTPSGQAGLTGTAGSDESVRFNGIATGNYTFSVTLAGFPANTGSITVADGNNTLSISLQAPVPVTGGVKVTVMNSSGNAVAGASVSSTSTPSGQAALSGVTAANGTVTFSGVMPGSYTIQASMTGYNSNSGSVTVVAGSVAPLSVTLQTQSSTSSGGVPGYPAEAVIVGLVVCATLLVLVRRKK
jgi:Carboxypeptidase regulatory-like domain